MILQPLFPLTQQFQNMNGSILAAGRVYVYYKNRTALATTYHDEEGTVVNANPVLLDNNGRATVFADTIYSYTIVVCDYYGTELFSQDITLHDAISTAENVMVISSNGSVKVDTTTLPNGVQYGLSVNTDVIATKESVANKKDKQNELNFNGSAIKTVKSITQNANGELNVEFEDINYPGYTISSTDGSINVSISEGVTDLTLPSDVVRDSAYTHIDAATSNPLMDGTAAVGVSVKYAREDHVHPSDTSREDIANKTTVVLGTSDSKYPTDKAVAEFVNSSIATNTANYISNNGEPFTSVEQLEAYSGPVTNNDYAFVTGTDSEGNTYYDRYKATVKGSGVTWSLEYRLNNSSFTAAQWSAINSGITSALVAKIHDHSNKDVLDGITSTDVANWNSKMDNQSVGNVSEPVYLENGIAKVATNVATKDELATKQNNLTEGDNITIDGNTISSDQKFVATYGTTTYKEVKAAYDAGKICTVFKNNRYYYIKSIDAASIMFASSNGKDTLYSLTLSSADSWSTYTGQLQSKLTFDTTPTAGSTNPVTSDGIKTSLDVSNANTAPKYDPTATYPKVGTLCTYNNVLYRSKVAINTAEVWTEEHWEIDSVASELEEVKASPTWVDITRKLGNYDGTQTKTGHHRIMILYSRKLAMLQFGGYVVPTANGNGVKLFAFNNDIVNFTSAEYYTKSGRYVLYVSLTPYDKTTTYRKPYSITARDVTADQTIEFQFFCPLSISVDEFDAYLASH